MLLYSYKFGSASGKALASALGAKRIKHENSRLIGRNSKVVINWGSSSLPEEVTKCVVFNLPEAVALAANKKSFFEFLEGSDVSLPPYTSDKAVAQAWLGDGKCVVERHKLTGNSGEGLVICEPDGELGDAPLYTMYINKRNEYRVHVAFGEIIDTQRKARSRDVADDDVNWKVRNMINGFIFARNEGHDVPWCVLDEGLASVMALGLDFGAVDIVYNENDDKAYVLEVNTAPGLSGTTLEKYVEAFSYA
jgi:hypothetical protein